VLFVSLIVNFMGGMVKLFTWFIFYFIRGALDASGVEGRTQRRSKYGTKRPKVKK
jgi:small subunit ribosomal protein S12